MFKLIVGLGNPGSKHEKDRHNAGFWLVDELARLFQGQWQEDSKFHGALAKIKLGSDDIYLLKPNTFMNRSGQAVGALCKFHKIDSKSILVVHDELDLKAGVARLKYAGGLGGHNGLKDISAHLGTNDYWRLRLGIGHPRDSEEGRKNLDVADYVLKKPRLEEQIDIDRALSVFIKQIPKIAAGDIATATMELHSNT
ncbi:aminoacyl-tRNA hydrolase [Polynucleobacter sp. 30F-ANTBAC]|uniref:aminoacyl-tRNA hydrolase n=1 Tax=Polynucleobacter sp. 30F-ANTBAC TaxID=2689095 RepID=UPI001C0E18F1|nr:aminoacyl-tRNA hydrolase [Polynucleobacter sp. 30F-ANTBAC]MBU3600185.1 aminoacyl-tRNA hydrolase [Polynucleobacter sp. 30F-ANTBAC]